MLALAPYSGTLGAAMEAALQGFAAIALSQYVGPLNRALESKFDASAGHGAAVVQKLLDQGIWDTEGYRLFYNVNIPPVAAEDVRGTKVTSQGFRRFGAHRMSETTSPTGRRYVWVGGSPQQDATAPGTDAAANIEGYISVTPMRADFTAHDMLDPLSDALG